MVNFYKGQQVYSQKITEWECRSGIVSTQRLRLLGQQGRVQKLSSDQHIGCNILVKYELSRSQSKVWLNQAPPRTCVFTQIWFSCLQLSFFPTLLGQETHQDYEKIISNLIPKHNSTQKVVAFESLWENGELSKIYDKNDVGGSNSI